MLPIKCRNFESSAEASGADSRSSTPPPLIHSINKAYRTRLSEKVSDEDRAVIIFNDLLTSGHFDVRSSRVIVIL